MDSIKKILLIDSDNELGKTIKTASASKKCKLLYADNSVSGIQKVFRYLPDLILYNTNLDPVNGFEVFDALKFTPSFSHISVIFFKDKNDEEIQYLINNNWNIKTINAQYPGSNSGSVPELNPPINGSNEQNTYDFKTLYDLSPNGIFIFDKNTLLSVNHMLITLLKRNEQDILTFKTKDIFEKPSYKAIKHWMKNYLDGDNTSFCKQVFLRDSAGNNIPMDLTISELKRTDSSVHFIGILHAPQGNNLIVNYQLAGEVCNLLKRENIVVSEALEKKITHTIKLRTIEDVQQKKSFFTKREDEVLRLSMEGLSIKVIADKLALSSRTVEKYRTKLMQKSGARNFVEVIVFSLKNNLIKI